MSSSNLSFNYFILFNIQDDRQFVEEFGAGRWTGFRADDDVE